MTKEHIKEQLARHFIGAMAAYTGIDVAKPERDYGVDFRLEKIETYKMLGKTRYSAAGKALDVQLKATSQQKTGKSHETLIFDLNVENFNDLVKRRKDLTALAGGHTPLVLFIVTMPGDKKEWLTKGVDELIIKGKSYWYYPSPEVEFSKRKKTQRIFIPLENEVSPRFFESAFSLFFNSSK